MKKHTASEWGELIGTPPKYFSFKFDVDGKDECRVYYFGPHFKAISGLSGEEERALVGNCSLDNEVGTVHTYVWETVEAVNRRVEALTPQCLDGSRCKPAQKQAGFCDRGGCGG